MSSKVISLFFISVLLGCGTSHKSTLSEIKGRANELSKLISLYEGEYGFFPESLRVVMPSVYDKDAEALLLCKSSDGKIAEWMYYGMALNHLERDTGLRNSIRYLLVSPFSYESRDGGFYRVAIEVNTTVPILIHESDFEKHKSLVNDVLSEYLDEFID